MLVDDHEVVRSGYRRLLESTANIVVAAEADTGESAVQAYRSVHPDVSVMDLAMPGIGGLEACRRILAYDARARLLVFSVHENPEYVRRALDTGVLGYLSKRSAQRDMLEAVRAVAAQRFYVSPQLAGFMRYDGSHEGAAALETLTPREFEVFRQVAEGRTVAEVAEVLNLSGKTIGHHYTNVRKKLGISNQAQLVRLAIVAGIVQF